MPRKKTVKRVTKRQVKSNRSNTIKTMEEDILGAPARLAAKISKEISFQKKKENQLKAALNKISAKIKKVEGRVKPATLPTTPTGKKQFNAVKKTHRLAIKTHSDLGNHLQETTKTLASLTNRQSKVVALSKQLDQFEREWARTSNKIKETSKVKPKQKKIKEKAISSSIREMPIETVDVSTDNVALNEATASES